MFSTKIIMEQRQKKIQGFAIATGIFAMALLLRVLGLRWGLPDAQHWYSYHPDEFQIFSAVGNLDFFNGQFNPHFFNYPSLYIYLVYIAHLLLTGFGVFHINANDPAAIWQWPAQILLTARWLSALFGAGTAVVVYAIIRSWRPRLHVAYAILGGVLMAVAPGHVQHSHFATVDVTATFWVALTLLLAMRAVDSPHAMRLFVGSGLVAGLAAATKYNTGLAALIPLCVLLAEPELRARLKVLLPAFVGMVIVGFVVGCPYSVLHFSEFWGNGQNTGVAYELLVHPRQGQGDVFAATGNGWWYHLTYNLPFVMTWPLLLLALGGVAALWRTRGAGRWGVLVFTFLFFVSLGFSQVRFMRYVLPLVPMLIIAAVFGAQRLKVLLGLRGKAVVCGLVALVAFWGSVNVLFNFMKEDPRSAAANYIAANATAQATVGMIDVPRFWSPPLVPQDIIFGSSLTLNDIEKTDPYQRFHFEVTGFDVQKLQQQKTQWFVMSEFEWRDEKRLRPQQFQAFMDALEKEYQLQGIEKHQVPLALPGRALVPHDFLYTNPEIRIYRRK